MAYYGTTVAANRRYPPYCSVLTLADGAVVKIFISWSKPRSRQLALALRDWLPEVIQQVDPWVSSEDIDKGQRWLAEVGAVLGQLAQGILCVTEENTGEPWLNFEAGALAKSLDDARVRPVLLGLKPSEVIGPLAQFQATVVTDREDMLKLVLSLNRACSPPLEEARLHRSFDRTWDDLLRRIGEISSVPSSPRSTLRRSVEEMVTETLERVRDLQRMGDQRRPEVDPSPAFSQVTPRQLSSQRKRVEAALRELETARESGEHKLVESATVTFRTEQGILAILYSAAGLNEFAMEVGTVHGHTSATP
jgi:hypothetical protein